MLVLGSLDAVALASGEPMDYRSASETGCAELRRSDAVITGAGTVIADDPIECVIQSASKAILRALRVVLDSTLRL